MWNANDHVKRGEGLILLLQLIVLFCVSGPPVERSACIVRLPAAPVQHDGPRVLEEDREVPHHRDRGTHKKVSTQYGRQPHAEPTKQRTQAFIEVPVRTSLYHMYRHSGPIHCAVALQRCSSESSAKSDQERPFARLSSRQAVDREE